MEKYKVAFFYNTYGVPHTGGTTVRPINLVKMLNKFGIDVSVFCTNPELTNPKGDKKIYCWKDFRKDNFNIFWNENALQMGKVFAKEGIIPILGTNIVPNSSPQHALPYVDEIGIARQQSYCEKELKTIKENHGKFWLSQSYFQEKEYRRLGLSDTIPVYRAPNPINIDLFKQNDSKTVNDKIKIAWTGKNNWAKHASFVAELAKALPDTEFYCLSDNDLPCLMSLGNVTILPERTNEEVAEILKDMDIFLSTSVTENQPLGVLEAMATGLPVIGFRTSGMPEIITEGYNGILVDLGNIQHYMVELKQLIKNEEKRRCLGEKAREYVVNNFSEEACMRQYKFIFDKYLEG